MTLEQATYIIYPTLIPGDNEKSWVIRKNGNILHRFQDGLEGLSYFHTMKRAGGRGLSITGC